MSWAPASDARCREASDCPPVELVIHPKPKDIGAFEVRRSLPTRERRAIGPFVFFDEMGPAVLPAGKGMDVRPHPHVNLATLTYLFEGAITHRDSLGTEMVIRPGAVNLMIAGRGIVHSERSPEEARAPEARIHGLQLWIALPENHEEDPPSFHHHPGEELPSWREAGASFHLLVGEAKGRRSPVKTLSPTLYLALELDRGAQAQLPAAPERGLYVVHGDVEIGGQVYAPGTMLVLAPGVDVVVLAPAGARCVLIGGTPLGPRHMFWNFVSSREGRIEQAKQDWAEDRFDRIPGDDQERIPLP